jgi:DNA-binding NarL/FixJ family response regulator
MNTKVIKFNENNPMLDLGSEVAAYTAEIRKRFKLSIFFYWRLYDDGSSFLLCDNAKCLQHHYERGHLIPAPLTIKECDQVVYNHVVEDGPFVQAKHDFRHLFNSHDAMDIACRRKNYVDGFSWSTTAEASKDIHTIYLKNQMLFDGFMRDFTDDFKSEINLLQKHKIIIPKSMRGTYVSSNEFDAEAYVLPRFTNTEKTCLNYLVSGLPAREISYRLDASKRTIEKHLANIRSKMGCYNNAGVVAKYLAWRQSFLTKNEGALIKRLESSIVKDKKLSSLTSRQRDCLLALVQGFTIKQLAYKFQISTRTAEKHFEHIKVKLNCSTNLDIIAKYCSG